MRVDWRWTHGPVSGPVHAVTCLLALGAVGELPAVDAGPGWAATVGVVGLLVTGARSHAGLSRAGLAFRVVCWSAATVWLYRALAGGVSAAWVCYLVGGAVAAGILAIPFGRHEQTMRARWAEQAHRATVAAVDAAEQAELRPVAARWMARLRTVCGIRSAQVLAIEPWLHPGPDGRLRETGYTLEVQLPETGASWRDIARNRDALASAEDLPNGCGIEVTAGASRRRALIEVNTHDSLRDVIPLPPVDGSRTIDDPIEVGVHRDGSRAVVSLQYECAVLIGQVGSGKSNEIHTLIAGLLRCRDTLVFVIDFNGAKVSLSWLGPWAGGDAKKPAIDWVAETVEEAELMTSWLVEVITERQQIYQQDNVARDDDKIEVSPELPQIILVVDEFATLPQTIKKNVVTISDTGRASRIRTLVCALRGTADVVPKPLLVQAQVRIAMRVGDQRELNYIYGWGAGAPSADDAPHIGYGFISVDGSAARVHKGFRTPPTLIRATALATDAHRPVLDAPTVNISPYMRSVYMDRWNRNARIIKAAAGRRDGRSPEPPSAPAVPQPPAAPHPGGMPAVLDNMTAARKRLQDAMAEPQGEDDFETIVSRVVVVPELVIRVLTAIGDADRMHTATIAERIGARQETLGALLSPLGIRPLKNAFPIDGITRRGYQRTDVEAAADRIRAGGLVPPDEVMSWRPTSS